MSKKLFRFKIYNSIPKTPSIIAHEVWSNLLGRVAATECLRLLTYHLSHSHGIRNVEGDLGTSRQQLNNLCNILLKQDIVVLHSKNTPVLL